MFKKGKSGNPGGRPAGKHLSTILMAKLKEHAKNPKGDYVWVEENGKKVARTYGELLIERLIMEATFTRKYNPLVPKIVMSYIDGEPQEHLDLTSKGEALPSVGESNIMEIAKRINAELKKSKT